VTVFESELKTDVVGEVALAFAQQAVRPVLSRVLVQIDVLELAALVVPPEFLAFSCPCSSHQLAVETGLA